MKQLDFHEIGPPFSESDLIAIETRVGFKLPDDVVEFLRKNNGGRPLYCKIFVPGVNDWIDFHEVTGIGGRLGMEFWLNELKDEIPARTIPIGDETYGNCILVKDDGGVYYWDLYGLYGDGRTTNVYKVADSFSEFIDSLKRVVL